MPAGGDTWVLTGEAPRGGPLLGTVSSEQKREVNVRKEVPAKEKDGEDKRAIHLNWEGEASTSYYLRREKESTLLEGLSYRHGRKGG